MSPALKGASLAPTSGSRSEARLGAPIEGEAWVSCPTEACDWSTIRPEYAAWSAGEAHRLAHAKGWLDPDGSIHVDKRVSNDPSWCRREQPHTNKESP